MHTISCYYAMPLIYLIYKTLIMQRNEKNLTYEKKTKTDV